MLPSSPSADYISDATLRLCFGRAVFCCLLFRRTGEHDCASPAVAPQGASRRRSKSLLKHRVQGAALPAMLPSSPSADLSQCAFLRLCFGRAVFCCPFPGELGSTTAHLRRLPRKGRAGGAQNLCSSIACRAQPCQRCSPVLQALIYLSMHFYGSASAEPFFVAPFPENRGARLRISGGCPVRGEPEALIDLCSSIAC